MEQYQLYLEQASGALSRRDYLTAMQLGRRAAAAPAAAAHLRADAYLVLAMSSLNLEAPQDALAYAVGACLVACRSGDDLREERAAAMISLVVAQYPYLATESPLLLH
jgi:hypothetical protein